MKIINDLFKKHLTSLIFILFVLLIFLGNNNCFAQSGVYSFQKAEKYYKNKDYKQAILLYSIAIDSNYSELCEAYNGRGYSYKYLKDNESAISDFKKSIEINPNWAFGYEGIGKIMIENKFVNGNYDLDNINDAIDYFSKAIECDMGSGYDFAYKRFFKQRGEALNDRAYYYWYKKDNKSFKNNLESSVSDYTAAIQIDPKYGAAYFGRGQSYMSLDDRDKACSDFLDGAENGSNDAAKWYNTNCR